MALVDLVTPPFLVAAGLLVASGATKLLRPDPAVRALESAELPSGRAKVRVLAAIELGVGMGCLVAPGRAFATSLAVLYGLFATFLLRLLRTSSPVRSCGCVGSSDAPPSFVHVGLDLVGSASGLAAVAVGVPAARDIALGGPLLGVPIALGLVTAGYLAHACAVYLPRAWASYRPHGGAEENVNDGAARTFQLSAKVGP